LDIIARDGATLVFIEVKARASQRFGTGSEAVTFRKRRRLARMAQEFLLRSRLTRVPCRFDVVSVSWPPRGVPSVDVFRAAFNVGE
jgi:putative endonuclease